MKVISKATDSFLFEHVPDFMDWGKASRWMEDGQKQLKSITPEQILDDQIFMMEWNNAFNPQSPFGYYSSKNWRKFVLAVFLADYVSYDLPVDRVSFERLLFVMHAFPEGFKVWWINLRGCWWPVGYTGWYPMSESMFATFENDPEKLKDRTVVPVPFLKNENQFLYLFNFSAAKGLQKSLLTRKLIKRFVEDINNHKTAGLACVTVSEDGVRVAQKFDMQKTGDLVIGNSKEGVYVKRLYKGGLVSVS